MGICITENYNSPPTGEVLAMQTPTKSRPTNPGNTGARRGFVWSCGVSLVMIMIMIMIMIRYWKDSTQCWLHPGGGGTLKTKRGLITTNLVQKYNY